MAKRTQANIIVRFAFLFALAFLIFSAINMQFQLQELRDKKTEAQENLDKISDIIDETNQLLDMPIDDEYIERVARRNKFCYPDEIVYYNNLAD